MKIQKCLLGVATVLMLSGCADIVYEGRADLVPLPENARSEIYYETAKIPVPEKERQYVGTLTVSASTSSYSVNELRKKVISESRKRGANAILLISIDDFRNGSVRQDQLENRESTKSFSTDSVANITQKRDDYINGHGANPSIDIYKVTIKVKLYKIPQSAIKKHSEEK